MRKRTSEKGTETVRGGKILGKIVGLQYYSRPPKPGDEVFFEREPRNEYDRNAVAAVSVSGRVVGHIERGMAVWLAPLFDSGKLLLKGKVLADVDEWNAPVAIDVFLTKKGKSLLKRSSADSPEKIVHNHVLELFDKSSRYSKETLEEAARVFEPMVAGRSVAPETKLVFSMFMARLDEPDAKERGTSEKALLAVKEFTSNLTFGTLTSSGPVAVLPVFPKAKRRRRREGGWISGKRAMEEGSLVIEEIDGGVVSKLKARNLGSKPALLIGGEGVKGAKQDRIINITMVVKAAAEIEVPVSCVERGRWRYSGEQVAKSQGFASAKIRRDVTGDIAENLKHGSRSFASDQDMVWHNVAEISARSGTESETESLHEMCEVMRGDLEHVRSKLPFPKGAVGVAFFVMGKLVSIDIFPDTGILKDYWDDIVESVAMEAVLAEEGAENNKKRAPRKDVAVKRVSKIIKSSLSCDVKVDKSPSNEGWLVTAADDEFKASALVHNEECAHFAGFVA